MLLLVASSVQAALTAYDLRCEMLHQPIGINTTTPALSWKLSQDYNGVRQSAYQILAASRPDLLTEEKADLWNSGRIQSEQSIWVSYAGKPLESRSVVYWQVKVWDENGKGGDWARGGKFSVGILDKSLWRGKYIGMERFDRKVQPLLYKSFDCTDTKAPAFLHISTLGYHEIYLNGERVGDDVLTPSVVEYSKRHQAMTYCLEGKLRKGRNDLVIWLGGGFYDNPDIVGVVKGGPYVLAQVDQLQETGNWQTLVATDNSWQARESGYYDDGIAGAWTFGGEVVKAAELLPDFSSSTLDAVSWQGATAMEELPAQEITPMMCEPNRIMMEVGIETGGNDAGKVFGRQQARPYAKAAAVASKHGSHQLGFPVGHADDGLIGYNPFSGSLLKDGGPVGLVVLAYAEDGTSVVTDKSTVAHADHDGMTHGVEHIDAETLGRLLMDDGADELWVLIGHLSQHSNEIAVRKPLHADIGYDRLPVGIEVHIEGFDNAYGTAIALEHLLRALQPFSYLIIGRHIEKEMAAHGRSGIVGEVSKERQQVIQLAIAEALRTLSTGRQRLCSRLCLVDKEGTGDAVVTVGDHNIAYTLHDVEMPVVEEGRIDFHHTAIEMTLMLKIARDGILPFKMSRVGKHKLLNGLLADRIGVDIIRENAVLNTSVPV